MASVDPPPSSAVDDDPAVFLQSIRELATRREQEDAERYRKLEEEVKKTREERAARRAERARSISPKKTDSTNSLPPLTSPVNAIRSTNTPPLTTPPRRTAEMNSTLTPQGPPSPTKDIPEFKGFGSARTSVASTPSTPHSLERAPSQQSASSLARSGTLSWQQRPASRGGSRPASMVDARPPSPAKSTSMEQAREPSRDQIAASLGSRDPSWFRQTADRGTVSAAYRKSKDESPAGGDTTFGRRGLPGMSKETPTEPERQSSPAPSKSVRSDTATRPSSVRDSGMSSRFSTATSTSSSTPNKPDLKSLIAADAPQIDASPLSDKTSSVGSDQPSLGRTMTMSSSQARLNNAPERPSSPTKGMGGFVQSAMMKRSDSVSKRWSTQQPSSLSRQNSMASVRSGLSGLQGSHSMPRLEPTPSSRESSNEPSSRPTSSSSNNLTSLAREPSRNGNDGFVKPALPHHSRNKSVASLYTTNDETPTSPPSSPSKRFSTKSSWIESALTKPESPKPSPTRNSQPSWMANIAKAKAERASVDLTPRTSTPKHDEAGTTKTGTPASGAPFGQGMLKRSDSRDLAPTPRSSTPPIARELQKEDLEAESEAAASAMTSLPERTKSTKEEPSEKPRTEPASRLPPLASPIVLQSKNKEPKIESPKPSPATLVAKPKPETPAKPQTDFRSTLRSRPPPEVKQQQTPEFLSKFGNLRKAQAEKYVAPDVLRDNITRGKNDLTKTGGPVKTARRDELRESLIAKKDDWIKAKEEGRELPGQAHERKISLTQPVTPAKPEALAKKDLLARSDSYSSPSKPKQDTPEALARLKNLKEKPKVEPPVRSATIPQANTSEQLSRQTSAPTESQEKRVSETSKLASRFNPGLAGILARGPPAMSNGSAAPSRSESPAFPDRSMAASPAEAPVEGPLQDMRKGRAKGPKKRKQGGAAPESPAVQQSSPAPVSERDNSASMEREEPTKTAVAEPTTMIAPNPRAPAGSAASVIMASMRESPNSKGAPTPALPEKPAAPAKSPMVAAKPVETSPSKTDVPEFSGFGSLKKSAPAPQADDNKENSGDALPSVKSAASLWGRQASPKKSEAPPKIQLPSKKDEEAAMRSAGLLASSSPGRSPPKTGLGIAVVKTNGGMPSPPASAGLPPKPAKSSRVVSGQLQEASPNKGLDSPSRPPTEAERQLLRSFGQLPSFTGLPTIDTRVVVASSSLDGPESIRAARKTIQEFSTDANPRTLAPQDEYTLFDEAVYVCSHSYTGSGTKKADVFVWKGVSASETAMEHAQVAAKKLLREVGAAAVSPITQGHEPAAFLQALGGILVMRRGAREGASKQYMLCGRKHLGHITFDEVDFGVASLCSAFVYLISYPVTLQQTKLYLWKGSACSAEEISAARLAAMDLSESGEIIEVDNGAEFASFLKVFGPGTLKSSVPKATQFWRQKAQGPDQFEAHLFRIQQVEQKPSYFTGLFTRRPSWNSRSSSRSPSHEKDELKGEAKHISPFTQADMEAEGIYLFDAYHEIYLLFGPLFASQPEKIRDTLLGQALLFAADYTSIAAEERNPTLKATFLFKGVPAELKMLFRHWDESRGFWGTGGLMAGLRAFSGNNEVKMMPLDEVVKAVCRQ